MTDNGWRVNAVQIALARVRWICIAFNLLLYADFKPLLAREN
jgi:hypothetical protein